MPDATATTAPHGVGPILDRTAWAAAEAAHQQVVDELTAGRQHRASRHIPHPVEDFLFTYYQLRPAQLRRWHPGAGVGLIDAPAHAELRFYRTVESITSVDVGKFLDDRSDTYHLVRELLPATNSAAGQFGCFGLHEWAMVYRQTEEQRRHADWPLRLGQQGTDEVVEAHQIKCSHHDAFRFFTPPARRLNLLQPDVGSRVQLEQPGCLHANMDIYKWAYKLLPLVPSSFVLEAFLLARRIREFDMRASPYDLAELGYRPVPVETAAGKAEYVAAQREFAADGLVLRQQLVDLLAATA